MTPLAITKFSLVNGLGAGCAASADALKTRRSALTPCAFETVTLPTFTGELAALESRAVAASLAAYDCRNNRLAEWGLESDDFAGAVDFARRKYGANRIGVFVGTSTSGILQTELAYRRRAASDGALPPDFHYAETQNTFSLGDFVQRTLALTGPAFVVSSACSSSAKVFGNAARMITAGICDAAVVGGVDTLCLTTLYGFHSLGLLSSSPCRPFDAERDGISLGEGAGFALLERCSGQTYRGATLLLGIGESCDAYHMSTPHPDGAGARLAMLRALASAGISPSAIDYVNAHGTASRTNDVSEDKAIVDVFGAATPVSSTKGSTGHLLGAAGITEAIISMLAMQNDFLPGSLNTRTRDPALRSNYLLDNRAAKPRRILSNSFGFGGNNCSLVLARKD